MLRAGVGFSTASEPKAAAAEAVSQALAQAGLRVADGALCFISSAHGASYRLITRTIGELAETAEVAGCSAGGVIAAGQELERGPSVAVLVLGGGAIRPKRLFVPTLKNRAVQAARELAAAARPALGRTNLLCLFPDTYNLTPEPFLTELARELPTVTVVGGGASEDGSTGQTFVFCGDTVSTDAVSGMLLAGDFEICTDAAQGGQLLGHSWRVTEAQENLLIALDGRPALDVLRAAIGPLALDLRRVAMTVYLAVGLDTDAERLQHGHYLLRNLVGFSPQHGVVATAHKLTVGERVGFALRSGEGAREELKQTLEGMQRAVAKPPAFGLYFDCVGRGSGLYSIASHDSAYISRYFPAMPLAGFFSGFEIGPLAGASRVLQYSGVLALISEPPVLS